MVWNVYKLLSLSVYFDNMLHICPHLLKGDLSQRIFLSMGHACVFKEVFGFASHVEDS